MEKSKFIQPEILIPAGATDIVPPEAEIKKDVDFAESGSSDVATQRAGQVGGGCDIKKESSSSCTISGFTTCSESDPGLMIILLLQAWYNGDWQTLATKAKTGSGTIVSLSQGYTVTPGYYYRTVAHHSAASGGSAVSSTEGVYIG